MQIFRVLFTLIAVSFIAFTSPVLAQIVLPQGEENASALDVASDLANLLDGARGGISQKSLLASLEAGALAGEPIALWRLGVMYENGDGVVKDEAKAFAYFSRIANDYASTPPKSLQADIVAQSFIKVSDYYRAGLPDAGVKVSNKRFHALLLHAASYFGDADAQYRVGLLYLDKDEMGINPMQSARWLSKSALKGHIAAQATLGNLLFNNDSEIDAQRVEGLMWLSLAGSRAKGSALEIWATDLRDKAMSVATPEQRLMATNAAEQLITRFGGS